MLEFYFLGMLEVDWVVGFLFRWAVLPKRVNLQWFLKVEARTVGWINDLPLGKAAVSFDHRVMIQ
jgi:hypothetical protein